ncbi:SMI1/KNR4 family protein [Paenibacillus sp. GCM10027626]|uniref:SMI1/KNR4 family protein n=1 Tax=Paenibacillus sp. GCM10027626 TaxID=3273411 RepID=UPI0036398892
MYLVSNKSNPVASEETERMEREWKVKFPDDYIRFLAQYGEGTYKGWLNVQAPDPDVLPPFVEYGFWEHDETCPITEEQIGQCISIGTTIDGDFLAVHPDVDGVLWLPRHSERIAAKPAAEPDYTAFLDRIYYEAYGDAEHVPAYFEPWNATRQHAFFHFTAEGDRRLAMHDLGQRCKERFGPDLVIENEYTGILFFQSMGGYVRFNYAYEREIAVFYEPDSGTLFDEMMQFLKRNHCRILT